MPEPPQRLLQNLMLFARVLRAAGMPLGPGKVLDAVAAVRVVGITRREDFYWALHAVLVNRAEHHELFDQAFHAFWRNPRLLERMMSVALPRLHTPDEAGQSLNRRLGEALHGRRGAGAPTEEHDREVDVDARFTWSDRESLRARDFEQMSADELARAKAAVARMRLPVAEVATRRYRVHPHGERIDYRATLRGALRAGSGSVPLVRARRRTRPPSLVMVCDISGSMSVYSRMLLHLAHTLTSVRGRVHSFVFGTRLTNITRHLRTRDVDEALDRIARSVSDWSGGTRIGECMRDFNRVWSRRVLGQGAVVLLISDGLDRDGGRGLESEMERLHKSCRRLIWLNPLLRYDRFEPRSLGMQAILPHVDEFRAAHNVASLEELVDTLAHPAARQEEGVSRWLSLPRNG